MNRYAQFGLPKFGLEPSRSKLAGSSQSRFRRWGRRPRLGDRRNPTLRVLTHHRPERLRSLGLTLVESMVALLILLILISVVLQLLGSTAWLASQSEQKNQAMHWIQADVENVKLQAREYEKNAFPFSPLCTQPAASGLAASFITDKLGGSTPVTQGPRPIGGQNLVLTRTATYASSPDPAKIVQLTYTVTPQGSGTTVATFDIEVVPYAAFKCP